VPVPIALDSVAPFEFFSKTGYYSIGDAICVNLQSALQQASRTGNSVKWHFNEQAYRSMNWKTSWNLPIREVYRLRAQQLRDQYRYLVLWFSGGADSATILQTFVDNNIHLDEVMISWPKSASEGRYVPNVINYSPENFISEWDFSIRPRLEWLAKVSPGTKITVLDFFSDSVSFEDFEDTWTILEKNSYLTCKRQRALDKATVERFEKYNDGLASISGIAPPLITVVNDRYLAVYFANDAASAGIGKRDYMVKQVPRNVEFFYWTPDMPEIVREQVHLLLDYLAINHRDREMFYPFDLRTNHMATIDSWKYEATRNIIKKLIYPDWDPKIFQSRKPTDHLYSPEIYSWFYKSKIADQYMTTWKSAMRSQYSMIDPKFLKIDENGVIRNTATRYISRFYPVAKMPTS